MLYLPGLTKYMELKKFPFEGFFKLLTMRTRRDAVSVLVFASTCFLVYKHCLSDAAFAAVVPLLLTHAYLSHKEKMAQLPAPPQATVGTAITTVVDNIRGQL